MTKIKYFAANLALLSISIGLVFLANSKGSNPVISYAWSGSQIPSVGLSFYSTCEGKTGEDLKEALTSFNQPDEFTVENYDNDNFRDADEAQLSNTEIISLYTRHTIRKSNSGASDGNYAWNRWNREHIYTQTRFPNSIYDNHNIFACEGYTNQQRSDRKYADVRKVFYDVTEIVTEDGHNTGCYFKGDYFEPQDAAKGEVARAILYCSVYYGYALSDIAYNADTILKWNAEHQVTDREIYRNNRVYYNQGNRNPFVDHPSYASKIYGGQEYTWDDPLTSRPTSVSLNKNSATLAVGETLQLEATVNPSTAINKNVTWSTSNGGVANVHPSSGLVTAYSAGTTVITVKTVDGNKTDTCLITVSESKPDVKSGCGGSIVTTSVILSSLSLIGIGLLLIKRKFTK